MLSNTFLETRTQRLLDGIFLSKKKPGVHVQRMFKMGEILSKFFVKKKKKRRKFWDLIYDQTLLNKT